MCTKLQKQSDKDGLFSVVAGGMTLGKLCESQLPACKNVPKTCGPSTLDQNPRKLNELP